MKLLLALCAMAACCLPAGCDKTIEDARINWDFVNYSVCFSVSDAATGADLLDPDSEHNILGRLIEVVYAGERYGIELPASPDSAAAPCANLPMQLSARLYDVPTEEGRVYQLRFGEFSPLGDYHGEEFTIEWGDGSSNTVRFDCYVEWPRANDPHVLRSIWLDDVGQESWWIRLRK